MAVWNAVGWLAVALSGFVTTAVVYRHVGVSEFGIWATIVALKAFIAFLDGGLAFGVARDAARADTEGVAAIRRLAAARVVYAILGISAVLLAVLLADLPGRLLALQGAPLAASRTVMTLAGIEVGLALTASPLLGIVRGRSRFDILAAASLVQAFSVVGFVLLLTPTGGLPGAAAALVIGRLVAAAVVYAWLRWRASRLLAWVTRAPDLVAIIRFAAPLWIVAAGTLIGLSTDVPIVGGVRGPAAAGAYAVGATIPALAVGLLYVLVDTAYPRLTVLHHDDATELTRVLMLLATLLGGLGLSVVALFGPELLAVWLGNTESLSYAVLAIYSVTWALNVPTHVLSLVAIARNRHQVLAPIVLAEAVVSLLLSVALAVTVGPIGPALGTLVTLSISNVIVLPALLLRDLSISPRPQVRAAILGGGSGILAGLAIRALLTLVHLPALATVVAAIGLTFVAATVLLCWAFIDPETRRRWWAMVRLGGWRVLRRERSERRVVAQMLEAMRTESPTIWIVGQEPLVTVRIATYDRGAIVAERSIASALAQTHRNLEILVVGDACDAKTEAAVRSVRDSRVRFENLPRRGDYPSDPTRRWMVAGAAPMNRALMTAQGDWIAPLDDDDEFTPDHVEVLLGACRDRGLEFAYGEADMEVEPGSWHAVGAWPPREGSIVHAAVLYDARLRVMTHALDSWRLRQPSDWNLWHRMRDAGVRMGFVNRIVCRHYLERRHIR